MTAALASPLTSVEGRTVKEVRADQILIDLEAAGLFASGKVHVISVCAIRTAFGVRWEQRREMVWDFVDALIAKRIGEQDFSARLDDETFLIVTPELTALKARIITVGILHDVLRHFLGESSLEEMVVKVAASFADDQLNCRALTNGELLAAMSDTSGQDAVSPSIIILSHQIPSQSADDVQLVSFDGRQLRFSSSVDPIIDLRHWAVAGHRIEPKLMYEDTREPLSSAERRRLLPRDVHDMDLSTLSRGLSRLKAGGGKTSKPSLILSISFLTLSNSNSRGALLARAAPARDLMLSSVIWEITDFDEGVPASRVKETASLLLRFGRSVFSRVDTAALPSYSAKTSGLSGFVISTPTILSSSDDVAVWLLAIGRQASGRSPTLIAASLPSKHLLPIAHEAGFTHATVRPATNP